MSLYYFFANLLKTREGKAAKPCILFNIPDGSKKESPTSYMSITNQVYFTTSQVFEPKETTKKQTKNVEQKEEVLRYFLIGN